jgi:hypothetical protein
MSSDNWLFYFLVQPKNIKVNGSAYKCNALNVFNNKKALALQFGWEGIPFNLVFNAFIFLVSIASHPTARSIVSNSTLSHTSRLHVDCDTLIRFQPTCRISCRRPSCETQSAISFKVKALSFQQFVDDQPFLTLHN